MTRAAVCVLAILVLSSVGGLNRVWAADSTDPEFVPKVGSQQERLRVYYGGSDPAPPVVALNQEIKVWFPISPYVAGYDPEAPASGDFMHKVFYLSTRPWMGGDGAGTITKVDVDGQFVESKNSPQTIKVKGCDYEVKWLDESTVRIVQNDHSVEGTCPGCKLHHEIPSRMAIFAKFTTGGPKLAACRAGLRMLSNQKEPLEASQKPNEYGEWLQSPPDDPLKFVREGQSTKNFWGGCRKLLGAGVVLKSLQFKSDYTKDYNPSSDALKFCWLIKENAKWADPSTATPYEEPEWTWDRSNPIVQTRATKLKIKRLVLDVNLGGAGRQDYLLIGQADENYLQFSTQGHWDSPGPGKFIDDVEATAALPDTVGVLRNKTIHWTITINDVEYNLGDTGPHTIFRTYDYPTTEYKTDERQMAANYMTHKRADGCCTWAEGKKTLEDVADALWNNLTGDPPYEPNDPGITTKLGATAQSEPGDRKKCWSLMDGKPIGGYCTIQASLMASACNLLGVPANLRLVRASTNQNCLDLEVNGEWVLIFAADPTPADWQTCEGCCQAAGSYYALWPAIKATSDYDMAKNKLEGEQGWTRWWVLYNEQHQIVNKQKETGNW